MPMTDARSSTPPDQLGGPPDPAPRGRAALTVANLAAYFLVGILAMLLPSVMPSVIRGFGLTLAAAGLVYPANAIGSLAGGLGAGIWSDRAGRKPLLCGGALLSGAALLGAYLAPGWPLFVACYLVLGLAQGAFSNSINAVVLDLNPASRGRALNALHGAFSVGAMVSPFAVRALLGSGAHWRTALLWAACAWLVTGVVLLLLRYPAAGGGGAQPRGLQLGLLADGLFAAVFAVAFIYNGMAWALLGWTKEYLRQAGSRPEFGSAMLSLFYLGLAAGRFSCARYSERLGYGRTLMVCAVGTAAAYPVATFAARPGWIALGILLTGLFQSGLFPTGLACAARRFPSSVGTVAGTLSIAMALGASLTPWWTGALGGLTSLSLALRLNYALVLPLVLLCGWLWAQERREGRSHDRR